MIRGCGTCRKSKLLRRSFARLGSCRIIVFFGSQYRKRTSFLVGNAESARDGTPTSRRRCEENTGWLYRREMGGPQVLRHQSIEGEDKKSRAHKAEIKVLRAEQL